MNYLECAIARSQYCLDRAITLSIEGENSALIIHFLDAGDQMIIGAKNALNSEGKNREYLHKFISKISAEICELRAVYE